MTTSSVSDTRLNTVVRHVAIRGVTPIMFDRYAGDNQTRLEWHQKIYLRSGTSNLCLPTLNLVSFFTAHNTNSAPKRLRDKRIYKSICNAILSFVSVADADGNAESILIKRDGQSIEVGTFTDRVDEQSGIYLHRAVARLDKGIPNPKERPVLPLPWSMEFDLTIYPNKEVKEQEIKNLLAEGGMAIGLGTFRGVFGKFVIDRWE
ncbi:hypothetical protein [Candidimonas nitroreducens]|uniref:Type III-B CRISPR module RAMP protein Cmr4 n=1 Tax=Candidimonas nitroreducens TaxID=683354 RepID=A0A225M6Q2_9BURK|nr:hypothetical protein [Candidimonas nitroreducens]OWT55241.1 hypothetical protein CEY11_21260 [Candidimonas nitroreducens]